MAGKIFINYRRDDASGTAGRLYDRLAQAFGRQNLFMDVDHIPAGVDFVAYLNNQVAACDVFLAVIGPNWLDAQDDNGRRRLDNPDDFVTVEIAAALARNIRVIPVLVDGARIPKAYRLPDSLKPLVRRNAVEVRNAQFGRDAEALAEKVGEGLAGKPAAPRRWPAVAAGAAALLLAGSIGLYQIGMPVWEPGEVEPVPGGADNAKAAADVEVKRKAEEVDRQRQATLMAEQPKTTADAEARPKAEEEARRDPALAVTPGSGRSFRDRLANGQPCPMCPEMVVVPSGSFMIGAPEFDAQRVVARESPQLKVTIARPFAVGKFAVTRAEFEAFVKATDHKFGDACIMRSGTEATRGKSFRDPGFSQDDKHPVVCVNFQDAKAYVAWLSKTTGRDYRLLSEAQREYVTRAGTPTPFWWGSSITPAQANYNDNVYNRTVPVDSFAPNPWGLYNVHGNVWEWTEDCWNESIAGNPGDGSARTATGDCNRRAIRGGSWQSGLLLLRSSNRSTNNAELRHNIRGFRLGRTLTP